MKVRIVLELSSKDPASVEGIKEIVGYIKSGTLQRDFEKNTGTSKVKSARCKATAEILED